MDGTEKIHSAVAAAMPFAPAGFAILGAYPNPLSVSSLAQPASIEYSVGSAATVSLQIVDVAGKIVRDLGTEAIEKEGTFTATWDAKDNRGVSLAAGTYMWVVTCTTSEGQSYRLD